MKHHFLNIEQTQMCSSIGNRTTYLWLQTSNIVRPITNNCIYVCIAILAIMMGKKYWVLQNISGEN